MMDWRDGNTQEIAPELGSLLPWQLRLYVAGTSPRSARALTNVRTYCDQHPAGQYALEVADVQEFNNIARRDQVLALPLLVRRLPAPRQCLIGDLSNPELLLQRLSATLPC